MTENTNMENHNIGWGDWARYAIKELERLSTQIEFLRSEVNKISINSTRLDALNEKIAMLQEKISEIKSDTENYKSASKDEWSKEDVNLNDKINDLQEELESMAERQRASDEYITKVKTVAWIIVIVITAIIGIFSLDIGPLFGK